ncbi:MAG: hypothetical protein HQK55_12570, partial [Deltaproteobacteria bacterium]|nr:hypothetical protein [Deltaproteobacteria bacterium]
MNIPKKISDLIKGALFILLLVIVNSLAVQALAADVVTLKVYEGYRFSDRAVTKSGDKGSDISFFVNTGRGNANSFA